MVHWMRSSSSDSASDVAPGPRPQQPGEAFRDPISPPSRSSGSPVSFRSLVSTHPYSAAFLLGSTLTLTFVSAAWLTKSVFFASRKASPAAAVSRAEAVWASRLQQAEQRFQAQIEAERAERAVLAGRLEEALAARSEPRPAGPVASAVPRPSDQDSTSPEYRPAPVEVAQASSMPSERWPSPDQHPGPSTGGIAASREWRPGPLFDMEALARDAARAEAERPPVKTKYPVTRHINLSRGFGRAGPLPVVDASNPNYIT